MNPSSLIIPAIDLIDGEVVRLYQGDYEKKTAYRIDPIEQLNQYVNAGAQWLHIVDLSGAKDTSKRQLSLIQKIVEQVPAQIQVGGGIRHRQDIDDLLQIGVQRIVIGSTAVTEPEKVKSWFNLYGAEQIVLALDININATGEREIAISGWQDKTSVTIESLLDFYLEAGLKYVLCTDISKDGTMQGSNIELYKSLCKSYPSIRFQSSGGIGSLLDIEALKQTNVYGVIVGKALLEGEFTAKQAFDLWSSSSTDTSSSTLTKRIIPCLDVKNGQVVKGVQFRNHEIIGDILPLAKRYAAENADELVFYDITASSDDRVVDKSWVSQIAEHLDIPFCVAGGIRTLEDAREILKFGADKISINSPALANPDLINQMSDTFGVQCIVVGIDSYFDEALNDYYVYQFTGDETKTQATKWRTIDWVIEVQKRGAGEIVINVMKQDGVRQGYDVAHLKSIRSICNIPLIASGGAGEMSHFYDVFYEANVDGALAASVFHKQLIEIDNLKKYLIHKGIQIRT